MGRSVAGVTISTRVSGGTGTVHAGPTHRHARRGTSDQGCNRNQGHASPKSSAYFGHRCLGLLLQLLLHNGQV